LGNIEESAGRRFEVRCGALAVELGSIDNDFGESDYEKDGRLTARNKLVAPSMWPEVPVGAVSRLPSAQ